ncbi:hypothetical protein GCM10010965_10030 [Caldalkalibacillus thermarum]|nr:hypothetical protein GCM10010965_10030 [Caldalkalibacillus thermarum]
MGYLITDNGHIYYEVEGNGSYNRVLLDFFQTILEHRDNYFLKPKIINPTPVPINTNLE